MNRKIPTAVASLATAFTVAVAVVPAASAAPVPPPSGLGKITSITPSGGRTIAKQNDGRYSKSAEARRKAFRRLCSDLKLMYETNLDTALAEDEKGNEAASSQAVEEGMAAYDTAKKARCSWAQ
jgi:hypothetical protein